MNEKRACELLLVPYVLYQLTLDATDYKAIRINNFIIAVSQRIEPDKAKLFKISKRTFKAVSKILLFMSDGEKYSGHKVVRMLFYLTQQIFDAKTSGKLNEQSEWLLKKIYAIMEYCLFLEFKNRFHKMSEEEFDKFEKSAKKNADKVFNNFYLKI